MTATDCGGGVGSPGGRGEGEIGRGEREGGRGCGGEHLNAVQNAEADDSQDVNLDLAVGYGNRELLVVGGERRDVGEDVEVRERGRPVEVDVEDTLAFGAEHQLREFELHQVRAVRDRNGVAEIAVQATARRAVQREILRAVDEVAGVQEVAAGGILVGRPDRAVDGGEPAPPQLMLAIGAPVEATGGRPEK